MHMLSRLQVATVEGSKRIIVHHEGSTVIIIFAVDLGNTRTVIRALFCDEVLALRQPFIGTSFIHLPYCSSHVLQCGQWTEKTVVFDSEHVDGQSISRLTAVVVDEDGRLKIAPSTKIDEWDPNMPVIQVIKLSQCPSAKQPAPVCPFPTQMFKMLMGVTSSSQIDANVKKLITEQGMCIEDQEGGGGVKIGFLTGDGKRLMFTPEEVTRAFFDGLMINFEEQVNDRSQSRDDF